MNGAPHVCEGFRSQLTRRELLRVGGLGLLGLSLSELLAARAQGGGELNGGEVAHGCASRVGGRDDR